MKANEAPEKIYLQQFDEDTIICLNDWNISEEWTDKPCNKKIATNIEYTRTDAFIEKARKWLEKNAGNYIWCSDYAENTGDDTCGMDDDFVDDFVNYMKGK